MCFHNRNEMFFQTKFTKVLLKKFEKYNKKLIKKNLHGNWFLWSQVPLKKTKHLLDLVILKKRQSFNMPSLSF